MRGCERGKPHMQVSLFLADLGVSPSCPLICHLEKPTLPCLGFLSWYFPKSSVMLYLWLIF